MNNQLPTPTITTTATIMMIINVMPLEGLAGVVSGVTTDAGVTTTGAFVDVITVFVIVGDDVGADVSVVTVVVVVEVDIVTSVVVGIGITEVGVTIGVVGAGVGAGTPYVTAYGVK